VIITEMVLSAVGHRAHSVLVQLVLASGFVPD